MSQKKFLDYTGLQRLLNKLKVIIPSKTSDLTNDSGFLTSHNPVDSALSSTSTNAVQNKVVKAELDNKSDTGHTHTKSEITDFPTLSTVATSGSYNDLTNKPTIPTVYNKTLTIQKNGTKVASFTSNSNTNVTANITVPTAVSELTNDSGYLTAHQSLADYSTKADTIKDLSISGKVITYTKGDDTTGTLTTQDTVYTHPTTAGNKHIPSGGSANQYLKYSASGTAQWATIKTSELNNDSGFLTSHNPVDSALSTTSENAVQNKVVKSELDLKANSADLSTVATTGSYTDLNNIPSNFTPASHTHGSITNDGKLGTASRALITDGNKKIAVSSVTSTELGYLSGVTSAVQDQLDGKAASTHSHAASDVSGLATVATSGSYNDLANKPTIPTVNNATLTIQKNGTTVKTFTANASANVTANITVPTKVSELTNDSGFLTSHNPVDSALSDTSTNAVQNKAVKGALDGKSDTGHTHTKSEITDFPTLATVATSGSYNDLSNKPTIPTVNNATLTIQKNGTTVKTFTANASSNVTANITVPTKVSELTNDSGFLTSASNLDSSKLTGTIDIARLPKGALERLVTVADQTARFALTTSDVQLGDTVKQLDTGVMYIVTDESKLSSADGYTEYTAGAATSVPWSGVTGKPSSYTPASHSHGNIANGGTLGTASRALITDGNKKITTSSVTSTELGYVSGVTSAIQTQLNGKAASSHTHTASEVSGLSTVATSGSYNDLSNKPTIDSALSSTSTNAVQNKVINTALSGKAASSHTHTKSQITDFPTKTSQFTNDSHQTITVGTDTTSTASPAHSGTFTCIDSVTRDSNGHVTAVNTKTVTLPADNNTDTLVTQNVSTANENHPVLLTVTKDATANQGAKTSIFASGVKVNPSTNTVTATTFSGALSGNASSATQFSANKSVTLTGDVSGTASSKAGWSVATTLSDSGVTAGTYGPSADVTGNNNATISVPEITVDSKGRVTSVANRTLTCKNNTYNVYNKTLTIQKNGTNVATFTSNSNTDVTANITVPTKTSELTNDSGYLTTHQSLSNYVTLNGAQTISGAKTFSGLTKTAGKTEQSSPSDLNDALYNVESYSWGTSTTNKPASSYGILLNLNREGNVHTSTSNGWRAQLGVGTDTRLYLRTKANTGGEWSAWKEFLTSHQSLSNYSTLANTVKSLSISGKTITVTPGSGSAYTLTTQDTVYTHPTTSGNKHIPSGGSSGQFLGWDSDGTAKWVNNPNTNTDTLMTQNVSTTNATYPVLLVATANATANQGAKTGIFAKSVKVNPSTNVISASGFSGPLTGNVTGNVTGNCSGSSGSCTGNAATATQFSANKDVTLTGYINGTASSKAGWSIATALKNCYFHTGGTVTNTYFRVASGILAGGWNRYETLIRFVETTGNASCTLRVYFSLDGSSLLDGGTVTVLDSVNFGTGSFNVVYKNDTDKTLFEIYFQLGAKNHQVNALVLYETQRAASNICDVLTMYNDSTPVAALPSDYTLIPAEFEKYCGDLVPAGNNKNLGSSDAKWSNVYATTFTGNLTGNVTGNVTGNCSGSSGSCTGNAATATQFSANTTVALTGDATGTSAGSKKGWSVPVTLANSGVTAGTYGPSADVTGNNNSTISVPQITVDAKGRVTSVTNRTLTCKNNTYTVNNATLTIQKNGTNVATFTSNASSNATANITVPTKVSELTNDSGFLTSHQSLSNYVTLDGDQTISGAKTFTNQHTVCQGTSIIYLDQKLTGVTKGTNPSADINWRISHVDANGDFIGRFFLFGKTNGLYRYNLEIDNGTTDARLWFSIDESQKIAFLPDTAGTHDLGTSTNQWKSVYANAYYLGTTAFGDIVTHNASEFLTSHQDLSLYPYKLSSSSNGGTWTYLNLEDSDHIATGFNGVTTTGNYHVRTTADVPGTPVASTSDGVLFVSNIGSAANISEKRRCHQIFCSTKIFKRIGSYSSSTWTWQDWVEIATTDSDISGNAATATTLKTARTINGVSFNGSANITITKTTTPATTDNSTKIATTAFVNSFGNSKYALNENFGKGTTIPLFIKANDFPNAPGTSSASIQYNDAVDGTKLYVWYSVCNSSEILDIHPTATKVSPKTGQLWRYLGVTVTASGLGHSGANPTGILGLFRRES